MAYMIEHKQTCVRNVSSETSVKWPLEGMVFQDRWSFVTGKINMILYELSQWNDAIL